MSEWTDQQAEEFKTRVATDIRQIRMIDEMEEQSDESSCWHVAHSIALYQI